MTLTANERLMLEAILDSEYHTEIDEKDRIGTSVWSFSANPFKNKRTASGVASSLNKKGFANSYLYDVDEVISITQEGFDALVKQRANDGIAFGRKVIAMLDKAGL